MIVTLTDDFDPNKILNSGQCFRCRQIGEMYRFMTGNHVIYIRAESATKYDVSCGPAEWEKIWIPYFDLGKNYRSIRHAINPDGFMKEAVSAGKGIRILRQDAWETLISFIISQRKSIPAIRTCIEALARLGRETIHTEYETVYAFPTASVLADISDRCFYDCGLGYRVPYVKNAVATFSRNKMLLQDWANLDDMSLLSMLKTIHGVGDKVANCVMLFAYGRTACVPIDTWIARIITEKYGGQNPFPGYGANAGIMQQYAFYYIQQHRAEMT